MLTLSRTQVALLLVPLVVLLTVAGSRFAGAGASRGPAAVAPLARVGGAGSAARTPLLFVHVVGAVRRAGLFRLRDGSRVADAVARAGGPTRRADLAAVNLAAPLVDGQQVVVPRRGPTGSAAAVGAGGPGSGVKVSLASATIEQLDELPGVGPVTAQKIVDWRTTHGPFRSVDDLDDVPGIGPARIEQLRDLVTP
ncbi:MAG TPA: ComEA family DNA-binding protein [Gaiella sp.]|nr:ComEA family DNA-binding protein [Gaiella sp.]